MKTCVLVGQRVKDFLDSPAPEPRRKLWRAIKALPGAKGDVLQLEGKLSPHRAGRKGNLPVSRHNTYICFDI